MAISWVYDPSQYQEKNFAIIPVGDYRARVADVVEKTFSSGNPGYEITLDISGHNSKLWFYLVLDASNPQQTNQRIGDFFNSFGITNPAMGTGKQWIGSVGAVRVKHDTYNGDTKPKVAYCIAKNRQDKLPAWQNPTGGAAPTAAPAQNGGFENIEIPEDLPFN
jgi:hypothetical protein